MGGVAGWAGHVRRVGARQCGVQGRVRARGAHLVRAFCRCRLGFEFSKICPSNVALNFNKPFELTLSLRRLVQPPARCWTGSGWRARRRCRSGWRCCWRCAARTRCPAPTCAASSCCCAASAPRPTLPVRRERERERERERGVRRALAVRRRPAPRLHAAARPQLHAAGAKRNPHTAMEKLRIVGARELVAAVLVLTLRHTRVLGWRCRGDAAVRRHARGHAAATRHETDDAP
jgi:hypothetical protein